MVGNKHEENKKNYSDRQTKFFVINPIAFNIGETLMKPAGNIISVNLAIISALFHRLKYGIEL